METREPGFEAFVERGDVSKFVFLLVNVRDEAIKANRNERKRKKEKNNKEEALGEFRPSEVKERGFALTIRLCDL